MPKWKICAVGAGVSGLFTAYALLSDSPGQFDVTIIAEHFTPHATSDVVFGLWEPYLFS